MIMSNLWGPAKPSRHALPASFHSWKHPMECWIESSDHAIPAMVRGIRLTRRANGPYLVKVRPLVYQPGSITMRRLALATLCLSLAGSVVLTGCAGSKPSEGSETKAPVKKKAELEAEILKARQEAEAQEKKLTELREEKAALEAELERKNNPTAAVPASAATPAPAAAKVDSAKAAPAKAATPAKKK
jgi:hypothetical protein